MFSLTAWLGKKPSAPWPGYVKVGEVEQFPDNSAQVVVAFGRDIGVFHVAGEWKAIGNVCPHNNRPIGTIDFDDLHVTCIWHGLRFSLDSGVCPEAPHYTVQTYPVLIHKGDVMVGPGESEQNDAQSA